MRRLGTIFLAHPGKANYPEIQAYRNFFKDFTFLDGSLEEFLTIPLDLRKDMILWCIMGIYTRNVEAKYRIHDYRSLSTGKIGFLKDKVKKHLNFKPDLRIFQNEAMKNVMGFDDGIQSILLPMGVPSFISGTKLHDCVEFHQKFCYIGEMSRERKFDDVLNAYISKFVDEKFILIGTPEPYILDKYKKYKQLMFVGRKTQEETLSIVKSCEYAISYFPYHRPHKYQAPTKLLEYMALGVKVICNDAPSNLRELDEHCYKAIITGADIFSDLNLANEVRSTVSNDVLENIFWPDVIEASRIYDFLIN